MTTFATYFLCLLGTLSRDEFNLKTKASKERLGGLKDGDTMTRVHADSQKKPACLMYQRTKIILTPEQTGHQTSTGIVRATNGLTKEAPQVRGVRLIGGREPDYFLSDSFTCLIYRFINTGYFVALCLSSGLQEKLRL